MTSARRTGPQLPAVVLAADRAAATLSRSHEAGPKALLRYGGHTCLEIVTSALRRAPEVERIVVLGDHRGSLEEAATSIGVEHIRHDGDLAGSLAAGLDRFQGSCAVLFTPVDLPLITPGAVTEFLRRSAGAGDGRAGGVHLAMVPGSAFTGRFHGSPKPTIAFGDVAACSGNLLLLGTGLPRRERVLALVQRMREGRKSPLRTALALGPMFLLGYLVGVRLLGRTTLDQMARLASRRMAATVVPVLVERPELALDVDEPEDHEFVERLLR